MPRKIETEIELPAPADVVFEALTNAEKLKQWFPLDARVKPGKGGSIWLSWGAPFEGEGKIENWEPGKRFTWIEERPGEGAPIRIAVDFHLESRGGKTILRLVQSGFGDEQSWDDEFESTSQGWALCFLALRHSLEAQPGLARTATWVFATTPLPQPQAWAILTGKAPAARAGERYSITLGAQRFEGKCLLSKPERAFAGTVENLGNGFLIVEVSRCAGSPMPAILFSTFGAQTDAMKRAHESVRAEMPKLFPK